MQRGKMDVLTVESTLAMWWATPELAGYFGDIAML
jgi:hypothetical protein